MATFDQLSDEHRAIVELVLRQGKSYGELSDYVLGQQAGPEATATRGHLRRSEAARSWTRSLLDALEQLYPNGNVPAIPDGERGARRGAAAAAARTSSPGGAAAVRRRQLIA